MEPNLDQDLHTLAMDEINESDVSFISHEEVKSLLSTSHISKLSEFEDVKTIGLGGIGTVMSGFDPNRKRQVAIKILRQPNRHNKNHIERFIKEARATAQIDHPNVVPVHSF
ncbi:MAG: protein kinase, partial [Victivallaceae bacterium]|nr:protein kinase [Victivallaceae bacterium]